jgi:hypothetical protein
MEVNSTELRIKLPKTTKKKRAGEGMRAKRALGATFFKTSFGSLGSGVGCAWTLPGETLFRGDIFSSFERDQRHNTSRVEE